MSTLNDTRDRLTEPKDHGELPGGEGGGGGVTVHGELSGRTDPGSHPATAVSVSPTGGIAATTVQAALAELDTEKAAAAHTHAIADTTGLQTALDGKAATGHTHTATQIADSTATGRAVLTGAAADGRTALGLGSAATHDEGPGGGLDADTVDGKHATSFVDSDRVIVGNTTVYLKVYSGAVDSYRGLMVEDAGTGTTRVYPQNVAGLSTIINSLRLQAQLPFSEAYADIGPAGLTLKHTSGVIVLDAAAGTQVTGPLSAASLDVAGAAAGVGIGPRDGSGTTFTFYNPTGDDLRIYGSTDLFCLTSGGKVGINMTAPTARLHLVSDAAETLYIDRYGGAPFYGGRRANGTQGSPTVLTSGQNITAFTSHGWNGSAFTGNVGGFTVMTAENWSATATGTEITFATTPNGTTSPVVGLRITQDQRLRVRETADIITGTGSPEGVVTAVVGSLFLRTDGGAGTTLYVKQSGTGNTGWAAK